MIQLLKRISIGGISIIVFFMLCGNTSAGETAQIRSKQELCAEAKKGVPAITAAGLKAKIDSGQKFVLLDVRTEAEYCAGHISGAVWMPRGMLELKLQDLLPDPNTEIIIYCGKGCRGFLAAKTLTAMGYAKVSNLAGGVKEWSAAGYPLYNKLGKIEHLRFGIVDFRKSGD